MFCVVGMRLRDIPKSCLTCAILVKNCLANKHFYIPPPFVSPTIIYHPGFRAKRTQDFQRSHYQKPAPYQEKECAAADVVFYATNYSMPHYSLFSRLSSWLFVFSGAACFAGLVNKEYAGGEDENAKEAADRQMSQTKLIERNAAISPQSYARLANAANKLDPRLLLPSPLLLLVPYLAEPRRCCGLPFCLVPTLLLLLPLPLRALRPSPLPSVALRNIARFLSRDIRDWLHDVICASIQ